MKILSLYDVTGIQRYIFGSNHLRLNVGASHLVHLALQCLMESCQPVGEI